MAFSLESSDSLDFASPSESAKGAVRTSRAAADGTSRFFRIRIHLGTR